MTRDAKALLRNHPTGDGLSPGRASRLIRSLAVLRFDQPGKKLEACGAAVLGHRWHDSQANNRYDTESELRRWLGEEAGQYDNPSLLWDVKSSKEDRYFETNRASKAAQYITARGKGKAVVNAAVCFGKSGAFLHLGIDPAHTVRFGSERTVRQVRSSEELAAAVDGRGGILPLVRLSSKLNSRTLEQASPAPIRVFQENIRQTLAIVLETVGMSNLQKHLDKMAEKVEIESARDALKNERTRKLVAKGLVETAPEEAGKSVAKNRQATIAVLVALGYSPQEAEAIIDKKSKNK